MLSVPIATRLNDLVVDVLIASPTNGQVLVYNSGTGKWANATVSVPTAANPTATIGTTAVNGSASTFMRSDAAPAFGNLTGDVTSVGMATTLTNAPVIAKVLTGYTSGAGTVAATDSILQAIQKLNGNDATNANLTGAVTSVGNATSLGSFTSAQLLAALTDETGTGSAVFSASPTLTGTLTTAAITASGVVTVNNQLVVNAPAAGTIGQIIKGATSQSADLFQAQDSTGAVKANITAAGDTVTSRFFQTPQGTGGGFYFGATGNYGIYTDGSAYMHLYNNGNPVVGATDATQDFGVAANRWRNLYATGAVLSGNGAASTPAVNITGAPYAAGTGTTNYPLVYLNTAGSTQPTTLSTAGTMFGVNTTDAFAGDLMWLGKGGTTIVKITNTGAIGNTSGTLTFSSGNFVVGSTNGIYYIGNSYWYNASTGHRTNDAIITGSLGAPGAQLHVISAAAGTIGQIIQGAASNSAALQVLKQGATRTGQGTQFQTSAAGSLGNVSGGCFSDIIATTSTTHTDGTFDTLSTITFVANSLIVNGDKHEGEYVLTFVGHATATREVKLAFAGINIFDSGVLTPGTGTTTVRIKWQIIRVSSTTCAAQVSWSASGGAGLTFATAVMEVNTPPATLTGLTLTGTNAVVLTAAAAGVGAAASDISVVAPGSARIEGFGS